MPRCERQRNRTFGPWHRLRSTQAPGRGAAGDGCLFSIISDGRLDMPPWGLVLSENERWDLVNYIKTFKTPQ